MSKSQTSRKRATQAPSATGQSETPPAPPARQTEPLRVESKSQTSRKRGHSGTFPDRPERNAADPASSPNRAVEG